MESIGIRELRQNASAHVARAASGETIEITDRGKPVARLTPSGRPGSLRDQMITDGNLVPAQHSIEDILSLPRIPPLPGTPASEEILDAIRADRP
jgi:prevent-host-death family protein